ncbi:hypothetical protein GCM10022402_32750 [Salinactinospora qingdaonensis]|uniref:Uncharacterized protein n=1 Tax=Salinactinospora qingdaonensis TaxID=702744 RepID=A0ABP7FZN9_9ACTN
MVWGKAQCPQRVAPSKKTGDVKSPTKGLPNGRGLEEGSRKGTVSGRVAVSLCGSASTAWAVRRATTVGEVVVFLCGGVPVWLSPVWLCFSIACGY